MPQPVNTTELLTILDCIDALVYVADMQTYELLYVNSKGRKLFGDIVGKRCWESLQQGQSGPCPFCTNYRLVGPDSTPSGVVEWQFQNTVTGRWFDIRDQAIPWHDGRLVRLEIATDVTDRKRAESAEQRSIQVQSVLLEVLKLSLLSLPLEEILQDFIVSISALPGLGVTPKGAVLLTGEDGRTLVLKTHYNLSPELLTLCRTVPFGHCLCGRAAELGAIVFADHVGEEHDNAFPDMQPHGHYCVPILSGNGEALGVFTLYVRAGAVRDSALEEILRSAAGVLATIIERFRMETGNRRLQDQLRQAQKMEAIGVLAGGIAHDFNNILAAVLGFAEMIQHESPEGSMVRTDIDQVITAGRRAKDLVQQILTFSRQGEQQVRPVQFHLIAKEALKLLRASIPSTITIRQQVDPESGTVLADPTQLHQILMNLCTNAYHAMREQGGELTVTLAPVTLDHLFVAKRPTLQVGPHLRLTVTDTGHGMNEATRQRIFEPYFTTKKKGEGTGLGLAVVHGIVTSLGGDIQVESEPGKGTTFIIHLPRIAETAPQASLVAEPVPTGTECILFVDDESVLADLGGKMLSRLGYTVVSRTSSIEALEAFRNQPGRFDLVITDYTMPNMTGIQLAQHILAHRPDLPIVMVTGFSDSISAEQAKNFGIREFLFKPLLVTELARVIRRALGDKSPEKNPSTH